jgi:hypothetical protein
VVTPVSTPEQNHLLASLAEEDFMALRPKLQFVQFPLGTSLYESGE